MHGFLMRPHRCPKCGIIPALAPIPSGQATHAY